MEWAIKAIGFSEIETPESIDKLMDEVLNAPSMQRAITIDEEYIVAEYVKSFAEDTYVNVRVVLRKCVDEPDVKIVRCVPGVQAKNNLVVQNIEVDGVNYEDDYYAFCEHTETGMQVVFLVQNVVEYLQAQEKGKICTGINITALAEEGTIILPVEKNEEDEILAREERDKLKSMLEKMQDGDEEARQFLEKEEKELDDQLKQRLKEEDFLTIMSGYFIPEGYTEEVYAILGEIKSIDKRVNSKTQESFYIFEVNVNDMPLEVVINSKTLVGMPSVGMRFMGTCWLQGKVIME